MTVQRWRSPLQAVWVQTFKKVVAACVGVGALVQAVICSPLRLGRRVFNGGTCPTLCRQLEPIRDELLLCLLGGLLKCAFHPVWHGRSGLAGDGAFYCPSC